LHCHISFHLLLIDSPEIEDLDEAMSFSVSAGNVEAAVSANIGVLNLTMAGSGSTPRQRATPRTRSTGTSSFCTTLGK